MVEYAAPGPHGISDERQPGHWLLASLGKRVLRPGGRKLTCWMLAQLALARSDRVVEFAPGLGATARLTLSARPRGYVAVERDPAAAARIGAWLARQAPGSSCRCVRASAEATGLPSGAWSAVYGEAMLTMQTLAQKRRIVAEAARLLQPGGRYAIHEIQLLPPDISDDLRREIQADLSARIHVGVQPLTAPEWRALLEGAGLRVRAETHTPMHLLEPGRVIADEGWLGALRIACNLLRRPAARRRVRALRRLFRHYGANLGAIGLVAVK